MRKQKLVLVGNGMAGVRTLEELIKIAPDLYDITVFGAEPHPNYKRILLSPVLAGEMTVQDIILNSREWYADNDIEPYTGNPVLEIDRRGRRVIAADGTSVEYDRLLLATGSKPFIPPVPGKDLPGGDRGRPARPGGRQRPRAARHGRDRGAYRRVDHGAPA